MVGARWRVSRWVPGSKEEIELQVAVGVKETAPSTINEAFMGAAFGDWGGVDSFE